jgi:hypothetical protein
MTDAEKVEMEHRMSTVEIVIGRIKSDLYNGDDNPTSGLVPEIRGYLAEERAEKAKRWKRSDKIAVLSIMLVVLAWPSKQVYAFLRDLYQIAQEYHAIHKSEIPHKSSSEPPAQELQSHQEPPQHAGATPTAP